MTKNYWNADNINRLLNLMVGDYYGKSPIDSIDLIRKSKAHEADYIATLLDLTKQSTVIDLGSGCGFIASAIAPKVKNLYCLDISKDFLNFCRRETETHLNVEHFLINYGDVNLNFKEPVDAIYAMALFIHFNLYDVFHYIKACFDCLKPGGKLLFDFYNIEKLNIHNDVFVRHAATYRKDPSVLARLVYYHHPMAVHQIYSQIGFRLLDTKEKNEHVFLILEK